jgi:hypothetical protein
VVLDTRTRRWRSEMNLKQPSGLLDWEALCELQQALLDHPSAIIVSPAPIFGVKLIETVQKVFSWCGYPLLVDAENWMAHRGAAQVILNIFRHSRTPGNYVVLSGDVHYSFVYEVLIRHRNRATDLADHQQRHQERIPRACWNGSTASTAGSTRRARRSTGFKRRRTMHRAAYPGTCRGR